ncbi:hypothetical protein CDD83_9172 [Cordyceps sp. RAO-2017]|nr:hypothetical protein CDD83_9172 [Cordyceps sp. RAO-2017]
MQLSITLLTLLAGLAAAGPRPSPDVIPGGGNERLANGGPVRVGGGSSPDGVPITDSSGVSVGTIDRSGAQGGVRVDQGTSRVGR